MPSDDELEDYWATVRPLPMLPDRTSASVKYERAMKVTTAAEAEREFERLVQHTMRHQGLDRAAAEKQERLNIGYFAGYINVETQARVEQLFNAPHPFFGSVTNPVQPTLGQVLEMGRRTGARIRQGSPLYCEHANEMPQRCPCDEDCYCKTNSCRPRDERLCEHANEMPNICPCPATCPCKSSTCRPHCWGCSGHVGEDHWSGCRVVGQIGGRVLAEHVTPPCPHMTNVPAVCRCGGSCPCRRSSYCINNHPDHCGCRACSGSY